MGATILRVLKILNVTWFTSVIASLVVIAVEYLVDITDKRAVFDVEPPHVLDFRYLGPTSYNVVN